MSARFPTRRSRGGDAAAPVGGLLVLLAIAAVVVGATSEPGLSPLLIDIAAVVLAAVGAFVLMWGFAYRRMAYTLTDSAIRIEWLGYTTVVSYQGIHGIYTGQRLEGHAAAGALRWPGVNVGSSRVRGLGRLRFFATSTDQSKLTLITLEHGGVIVSAQDPQEFRAALIERVEQYDNVASSVAASGESASLVRDPIAAPWTALADPWLLLWMGLGILVVLLMLGAIDLHYAALADMLPLHTDATGPATQISRADLFHVPLIGFLCLAIDVAIGIAVHPRERLLARLLWLGGAVVQLIVLLGVLRLVA